MRCAVALSSIVVAFSDSMRAAFVHHFPAFDGHNVLVIHPSVVVDPSTAPISAPVNELASSAAPFVLLVTGIRDVKDPTYLIEAIGRRACETLLVVGPVLNRDCYERFDDAVKLWHNHVVYGGNVSSTEVHYLMRNGQSPFLCVFLSATLNFSSFSCCNCELFTFGGAVKLVAGGHVCRLPCHCTQQQRQQLDCHQRCDWIVV